MGKYSYPAITVDIVVFTIENDELKILLIKRRKDPFKDRWAFPGGFVDKGEPMLVAAKRELEEETSVKNAELEKFDFFGDPGRDPRGRTISGCYMTAIKYENLKLKAGTDAAEAKLFPALNPPNLAFDHHKLLESALNNLRYNPTVSYIVFKILPREFTLTQLKNTCEIAFAKKINLNQLQKKIEKCEHIKKITEEDEKSLYSFNKNLYMKQIESKINILSLLPAEVMREKKSF